MLTSGSSCLSKCSGFTLIEVLCAIGIFSIAILGMSYGAVSVIKSNKTAYNISVATQLAQDKMEELKANPSTLDSGGPVTDTINSQSFTRNWTVTPDSPADGVIQIDVTVTWTDYSDQSLTISSAVQEGG